MVALAGMEKEVILQSHLRVLKLHMRQVGLTGLLPSIAPSGIETFSISICSFGFMFPSIAPSGIETSASFTASSAALVLQSHLRVLKRLKRAHGGGDNGASNRTFGY